LDRGGGCGSAALFPTWIPLDAYLNGQGIGSLALVYGPRAGGGNAGAVAAALDRGPYPVQFSGMDGLYNSLDLLNFGDPTQLRSALVQLDGEVHVSARTVLLGDSLYLRQTLLGRMRQASVRGSTGALAALGYGGPQLASADRGEPEPYKVQSDHGPGFEPPPRDAAPDTEFWLQGVAAWGQLQGTADTAGIGRTLAGFFAGVDRRLAPHWVAGIAGGYTSSSVSMGERSSSAAIAGLHVAGYTGATFGAWDLRGGASASFNTVSTSRSIVIPGFFDSESAQYGATTTQLFGEVGYRVEAGGFAAEPFAGLALVHLDTDAFAESGSPGTAGLRASAGSNTLGFSALGVRAATSFDLGDRLVLTPQASIAWQHALGNTAPTSTLAFTSNGASFTTTALPLARDVALVEAGLVLHVDRQLAFQMSYFGQIASGVQDVWLSARLNLRF
jgi:outer membrane autotransporter protein